MELTTLLAIALSLAMDAFAVAVATGIRLQCVTLEQTGRMAGIFGLFQGCMPILGWFLGTYVEHYVTAYDHWLAFGLLSFIGVRMLQEAWKGYKNGDDCECTLDDPTTGRTVLLLALATSVDALAVGFSLALLQVTIWLPAVVIGVVCLVLTAVGMHLGRMACKAGGLGHKANAVGGLVLIGIGINILHSHGVFS